MLRGLQHADRGQWEHDVIVLLYLALGAWLLIVGLVGMAIAPTVQLGPSDYGEKRRTS